MTTPALTYTTLVQLPEIESSHLREAQWACDWWRQQYVEAKEKSESAWKTYSDAIDNNEPREYKDALYEIAKIFDAIRRDTWVMWDQAKAIYLALHN
jgi:hypothetical protein